MFERVCIYIHTDVRTSTLHASIFRVVTGVLAARGTVEQARLFPGADHTVQVDGAIALTEVGPAASNHGWKINRKN